MLVQKSLQLAALLAATKIKFLISSSYCHRNLAQITATFVQHIAKAFKYVIWTKNKKCIKNAASGTANFTDHLNQFVQR